MLLLKLPLIAFFQKKIIKNRGKEKISCREATPGCKGNNRKKAVNEEKIKTLSPPVNTAFLGRKNRKTNAEKERNRVKYL
jgi:hypothetical protein